MIKLNLKDHLAAQDMLTSIMKANDLSVTEAIAYAINPHIYDRIIETGWGPIALPLWGHGGPQRKWERLDNPHIELELESIKLDAVKDIAKREGIDTETAIAYFLLFTMEALGYHI